MTANPQSPMSPMKRSLRVLGVDPALAGATGYGVIEMESSAARMLRFGALRFSSNTGFSERLRKIHRMVSELVQEFGPDAVAVESVFAALNVRTALRLAEVRGVVLLAAAQAEIPSHSYSPREVKASITGHGSASKEQMQRMIQVQLGLCERPEPADAADALAVALCHAHATQSQYRLSRHAISNSSLATADALGRQHSHSRSARILSER